MTTPDTRPAIPPVEGHRYEMRNGSVTAPLRMRQHQDDPAPITLRTGGHLEWPYTDGKNTWSKRGNERTSMSPWDLVSDLSAGPQDCTRHLTHGAAMVGHEPLPAKERRSLGWLNVWSGSGHLPFGGCLCSSKESAMRALGAGIRLACIEVFEGDGL